MRCFRLHSSFFIFLCSFNFYLNPVFVGFINGIIFKLNVKYVKILIIWVGVTDSKLPPIWYADLFIFLRHSSILKTTFSFILALSYFLSFLLIQIFIFISFSTQLICMIIIKLHNLLYIFAR